REHPRERLRPEARDVADRVERDDGRDPEEDQVEQAHALDEPVALLRFEVVGHHTHHDLPSLVLPRSLGPGRREANGFARGPGSDAPMQERVPPHGRTRRAREPARSMPPPAPLDADELARATAAALVPGSRVVSAARREPAKADYLAWRDGDGPRPAREALVVL